MIRLIVILLTVKLAASATIGQNLTQVEKGNDSLFYRHSLPFNIAGLVFRLSLGYLF